MVVAVSLRKASDPSYSSIVGAGKIPGVSFTDRPSPYKRRKLDVFKMWKRRDVKPEILVDTFRVMAGPNPLEVEARIEN